MDGLANFLNSLLQIILDFAETIAGNAVVSYSGTQGAYSGIWGACTTIANTVIEPIAVMIVVVFFLLSLLEKVSAEQFTLEHVLRDVIKLCLGLYLVTNSVEIVVGCIELGNGILNKVTGTINSQIPTGSFGVVTAFTGDKLEEAGFWAAVFTTVLMVAILLIQMIVMVIMKAIAMIRIVEIALRTSLSPIALSDTFAGNLLHSNALNFIRSFAALCLQGVFIAILANALPMLMIAAIDNGDLSSAGGVITFGLEMIVAGFICLILMFKAGSFAKEITGARG